MLTLQEKKLLLRLLKKNRRFSLFRKKTDSQQKLIEKLEQMIRNEEINMR